VWRWVGAPSTHLKLTLHCRPLHTEETQRLLLARVVKGAPSSIYSCSCQRGQPQDGWDTAAAGGGRP
jgi:hypothetical protein